MAKTAGDGGGSTARAAEDRDKGRTQENDGVADSVPPLPLSIGERSGAGEDRDLRREVGKLVVDTQQTIDSHLTLFRVGCILTVVGSLAAAIRLSGLMHRVNSVEEIPLWHFARRKKLRVRMIRQSQQDPSVFYVYHTPFLRRTVLQDVLPKSSLAGQGTNANELLAVRPFGVQVDESAQEWVWANFVSSNRYLTIQLLQRINVKGSESVATCGISLRRPPFGGDFAQELVSYGYAECLPEMLEHYDNGSEHSISSLAHRLQKLEAAQKHAQMMQYGIWEDWQEEKLSDRVMSAGKRATSKGFKTLLNKIRH